MGAGGPCLQWRLKLRGDLEPGLAGVGGAGGSVFRAGWRMARC